MDSREAEKRIETMESEIAEIKPELSALRDNLVRYEISSAQDRQDRDRLIKTWADVLHSALKQIGPIDVKLIHAVIDNMEDFLNRSRK